MERGKRKEQRLVLVVQGGEGEGRRDSGDERMVSIFKSSNGY
jgi:hypothetical protein